jgi:hypothetical protein
MASYAANEEFVLLRFGDLQQGRAWSGTSSDRTTGSRHKFHDISTLGPKGHDDYHPWHECIAVLGLGANAQLKPAFGWSEDAFRCVGGEEDAL